MGRVNRLTERRVLRRAADQALALPALDRLAEPPPPHRSTTPGYAPSDRDVHTRTAGARSADDWDPGDSPAASPSAGDYTEQPSTGFWDDRPGSPVNHYTTASTITAYSPTPVVRRPFPVEDRESDSTYGRQAARDDYAEETRSPAAAATTARPHHQDLSPISPVQRPGLLLTQGTAWSGDYRLRPWYRTRRAAAAFAGAAAAIVAAGILLAAHTPSDRHQQPTIVAPQVSTTQPTPHTTAQTSMSTPPPPPAAPPPPPPPAPPPQDAPAPTWRNSVPRQTTPSDDEPPRINVSRPPISVAPKPVTPPVTAAPGQNRRGGWGW